jgi:hypothetical protein
MVDEGFLDEVCPTCEGEGWLDEEELNDEGTD